MNLIHLSIIIPAYNESKRIGVTLNSLDKYLKSKDYSYEIIVVNDGSTDNTESTVRAYANRIPELTVISNDRNRGKGYSVRHGMQKASGQYCLFMDADNSVDISHLQKFLECMNRGTDVAIGSIRVGHTKVVERNGLHRRFLAKCANFLIQSLATPGIEDTQRGFKLFNAKAAEAIFSRQTIDGFGFDIEILVIARMNRLTISELPVVWDNPAGSTVTIFSYFQTLLELIRIVLNKISGKYNVPYIKVMKAAGEALNFSLKTHLKEVQHHLYEKGINKGIR